MQDPQTLDSDELLASIINRLAEAAERGERVDVEAEVREHPELAEEIRGLWATAGLADVLGEFSALDHRDDGEQEFDGRPTSVGPLPRRVGDYELAAELGRGGMGVVYRARQLSLRREVALKMILRGELASDVDLVRFRSEAASAAKLEHPHIVSVIEVGEEAGQPYFSMQYVEGTTLARRLADGPLPPREAAELLIPVCRAIGHAHRQGVLHRDLKPSNILIDRSGRPYVTDFGLAKRFPTKAEQPPEHNFTAITQSGAILGTPGYIAPEQAGAQRGDIGTCTDVYSLGAILYAMLTGRAPFQAATPIDTVLMVIEQEPPPPRLLNPKADPDLELIALKALQKPPDLRYESADALADDLEAYLRGDPIAARSSHFSQVLSRAFRPTPNAAILHNWGLLWMWHALVLLVLCLVTNWMQLRPVESRLSYIGLWSVGLGTWAIVFWNLRRRAGPVTFVERQIAHIWAASMACSLLLFAVEGMMGLKPLTLSPVLALIAGAVFVVKAGILSGEFYIQAAALFATCIPMALFPDYGLTIFGVVSAATFFIPGWKFHRQRT
jgi:serine/threonine-protein kinase